MNKTIIIIIMLGFLVPLTAIALTANCEKNSISECLLEKQDLMPDFYWHYNIIKYLTNYGDLPEKVLNGCDGGPNGDILIEDKSLDCFTKITFHAPLYYYLSSLVLMFSRFLDLNEILMLQILSLVIFLFTNILFFILLKNLKINENFIKYSLMIFIFLPLSLYHSIMIHDNVLFYFLFILVNLLFLFFSKNPKANFFWLGLFTGLSILTSLYGIIIILSLIIYLIFLILKKDNKAKFLFLSLVVSIIVGSYTFIRNYNLFGHPLGNFRDHMTPIDPSIIFRYFSGFWGGISGGYDKIYLLVAFFSLLLTLTMIIGILKYYKLARRKGLNLFILVGILTLISALNLTCNFILLAFNGTCVGNHAHGRYFLSLIPVISIFSGIALSKINNKTSDIIIYGSSLIFSIDFIFALVS